MAYKYFCFIFINYLLLCMKMGKHFTVLLQLPIKTCYSFSSRFSAFSVSSKKYIIDGRITLFCLLLKNWVFKPCFFFQLLVCTDAAAAQPLHNSKIKILVLCMCPWAEFSDLHDYLFEFSWESFGGVGHPAFKHRWDKGIKLE